MIGAWQKKLGHRSLWENFNLGYENGPLPTSGIERARSRPLRASTRKSTGGISAPRPVKKIKPPPRRKSADFHYSSDSSLTPLPSSDDEDGTSLRITTIRSQTKSSPSSGSVISRSTAGLPPRDSNDHSVKSIDRGVSRANAPQDINMDPGNEPPPTPPQGIGVLVNHCHPANSTTPLTEVDDPMNGTSVSAVCLQSRREPSQSMAESNDARSLSAPVPRSSSAPRRRTRPRTNWYPKRPSKQKKIYHVEETIDRPMAIDTPAVVDQEPELEQLAIVHQDITPGEPFIPKLGPSEPPSLKLSIHPPALIPPIVPEIRVPFSTSYTNIPLPRPAPASNLNPSPDGLKGLNDTSVAAVPGFLRPTLPSNPPIWAQVSLVHNSRGTYSDGGLVASRALRILRLLQGVPRWRLL